MLDETAIAYQFYQSHQTFKDKPEQKVYEMFWFAQKLEPQGFLNVFKECNID